MSRLIDADTLKRKVQKEATESWKMKIKASVETILNQVIDWIDEAQTVEPEQQWIQTSVRPPKDFDIVYIQTKWGNHEICKYIPKKVKPKAYPDGFWGDADCPEYDYFDVDAWMPLPMPWEGGAE